jgi:multidrug efflux pump subunit AcrA (membrane-fusion protein)
MKITNIIPEGTVVKKGDFVADLDKSEITGKFKDSQLSVQKLEAQYLQTRLDSTLALSQARDELVNLSYTREEKRLLMEQSVYEAPAMRRQAEIDFERAQRAYEQAGKNYVTKKKQSIAKAQAAEADLMKERRQMDLYQKGGREHDQCLGADRGDAPRPARDGVHHVHQRAGHTEDRPRSAGETEA